MIFLKFLLKEIPFLSKNLQKILFFFSPSRSKSVKITYFLFFGNSSINLKIDFLEITFMSLKPNFINASLSFFPSTIKEKFPSLE